jgi:hypothetical protein
MTMMKKGYKAGGKLPMKKGPDGKMVPEFAMDGEGANDMAKGKKMKRGGMMKKKGYAKGGMMKKKGYAKGGKVRGCGIARKGVRPAKMV